MGLPDYTEGVILYAWNGTAFVPVLVDTAGNIVGVFKGQYGTTLKTVKVDSEGRLTAFMADPQDIWGNILPIGSGELASRLGSPKTYDKRGDVLFIDNFQNGLSPYYYYTVEGACSLLLKNEFTKSGGYCLRFQWESYADEYAFISKGLGITMKGKLGLECSFAHWTNNFYIDLEIFYYDGTDLIKGEIRLKTDSGDIDYLNSGGTYTNRVSGLTITNRYWLYNTIKLVVDIVNKKYTRLLFNNVEYDMSTIALRKETDPTSPQTLFYINIKGIPSLVPDVNIDNVIITQNEP